MVSNGLVAKVAALAGEPAHAGILNALMEARALTATELSKIAGITPPPDLIRMHTSFG
jgi:hypothetical protein